LTNKSVKTDQSLSLITISGLDSKRTVADFLILLLFNSGVKSSSESPSLSIGLFFTALGLAALLLPAVPASCLADFVTVVAASLLLLLDDFWLLVLLHKLHWTSPLIWRLPGSK
jgi:hypothetical protein